MKHKYNRILMGTAVTVAAIASAVDHTRHQLPVPEQAEAAGVIIIEDEGGESPCSLNIDASPCSLN